GGTALAEMVVLRDGFRKEGSRACRARRPAGRTPPRTAYPGVSTCAIRFSFVRALVHDFMVLRGCLTSGPVAGEDDMAMESAPGNSPGGVTSLSEAVARTIRHEVGDLLQTVYATAAILQERLPPEADLERRVVADMRGRATLCRNLLDTGHDLACPVP